MSPFEEEELIRDLKTGQAASLERLYGLYAKKVYHLAYRILGHKEEAEDITQETFLRVYRNIGAFDGRSRLYTWIYAITSHLCYRAVRKQKQTSFDALESLIQTSQDPEMPADMTPLEMHHLTHQIKEGCLLGLLRCLSFYQRSAFILHVLVGLSIREVAEVLEKSEPATKVLVHRARENLKKFLCQNCSLYDPGNSCRCQNLIGFSLKQGWTVKPSQAALKVVDIRQIEKEIKTIRTVVQLYQSLSESDLAENLISRIQGLIKGEGLLIFS